MKRVKRLLTMICIICLILSGCGKKREGETPETVSKTPSDSGTTVADEELWNPQIGQRQFLLDGGYAAGVLFLGYVDGNAGDLDSDREYYNTVFEEQGYLEDFPFLSEIPNSNFVHTEYGQELYCIIPQDDTAAVCVNQWIVNEENDYAGEAGDVLYHSEYGSPILVKCNVSEIMSDVEIVVDDNKNPLHWCPYISGMDGHVVTDASEGKIYDFTNNPDDRDVELLDVFVGKVYDYYWSEAYEMKLASVTVPLVALDEEAAEAYPELNESLHNSLMERETKLYDNFASLILSAEELYPDLAEYFSEFEAKEEAIVRRADSNVFSLLYRGTTYEGGAHGYTYYWGDNYDTKTGELLTLDDVVLDREAFSALVWDQLNVYWDSLYFYEDLDIVRYFEENWDSIPWTLDYHGITIFFNPYEIAPYASGIQIVTVPYADEPEVFADQYTNGAQSYGIQLDLSSPFYYDVDSDGELDELLVYGVPTDDLIYVEHNIYIDGECYEQSADKNPGSVSGEANEIYAFEIFKPHLVHMVDGRNYLFIENLTDSDMRTNTVYELTDGTVRYVETLYNSLHSQVTEENWYVLRQALTNPYDFKMDTRTWGIGTRDGYKSYHISEEGYSYSYDEYYTFDPQTTVIATRDFEVMIVDEYGNESDTAVVSAGEELIYYRTDASLFADFILPDGRIGRVELEWDCGTCYVNGIDVVDLFEGIVFAG